ncbi:hypothetical protein LTR44_001850 [Exophiala sp. CCFEE 6388]|nr:hypothetical protein LTR44_001850 [Eurotiomycetes sp. CCFEE 6388]
MSYPPYYWASTARINLIAPVINCVFALWHKGIKRQKSQQNTLNIEEEIRAIEGKYHNETLTLITKKDNELKEYTKSTRDELQLFREKTIRNINAHMAATTAKISIQRVEDLKTLQTTIADALHKVKGVTEGAVSDLRKELRVFMVVSESTVKRRRASF